MRSDYLVESRERFDFQSRALNRRIRDSTHGQGSDHREPIYRFDKFEPFATEFFFSHKIVEPINQF
jgi:hypothetical protein